MVTLYIVVLPNLKQKIVCQFFYKIRQTRPYLKKVGKIPPKIFFYLISSLKSGFVSSSSGFFKYLNNILKEFA